MGVLWRLGRLLMIHSSAYDSSIAPEARGNEARVDDGGRTRRQTHIRNLPRREGEICRNLPRREGEICRDLPRREGEICRDLPRQEGGVNVRSLPPGHRVCV